MPKSSGRLQTQAGVYIKGRHSDNRDIWYGGRKTIKERNGGDVISINYQTKGCRYGRTGGWGKDNVRRADRRGANKGNY